jgi:uncharacterized protein (DUF2141 family)
VAGFPLNLSCTSYGFVGSGTYTATAIYSGYSGVDSNGDPCGASGASTSLNLVVPTSPTTTTMTVSGPVQQGQTLTVIGTANSQYGNGNDPDDRVYYPPTGFITLYYGPVALAQVQAIPSYSGPANATSTFTIPTAGVPPGQYAVHAVYAGDGDYTASTSPVATVLIEPSKMATATTLSASLNPIITSQTEALTVTVTPTGTTVPTGTVTLLSGSISFGTITLAAGSNGTGTGTFSVPLNLPAGSYPVLALYGGDTYNLPSTSSLLTVNIVAQSATTTTLTATPASVSAGQSTTLTATIVPTLANTPVTGSVAIKLGANTLSTLNLNNGTASLTLSTAGVPPGSYALTADYSGSALATASTSSAQTVTVLPASTVIVTASPNPVKQGSITTLTTAVTAANNSPVTTGTVTFSYAGETLGSASLGSNGTAQLPIATSSFTPGTYGLQATYSGSGSVPAATGTLSLVVN